MKKYEIVIPKKIKTSFQITIDLNGKEKQSYILKAETRNFQFEIPDKYFYIHNKPNKDTEYFDVYLTFNQNTTKLVPQEII